VEVGAVGLDEAVQGRFEIEQGEAYRPVGRAGLRLGAWHPTHADVTSAAGDTRVTAESAKQG
jgi:hypothetical protein